MEADFWCCNLSGVLKMKMSSLGSGRGEGSSARIREAERVNK